MKLQEPETEASIAVLLPCYNESLTIAKVVDDFRKELPSGKSVKRGGKESA